MVIFLFLEISPHWLLHTINKSQIDGGIKIPILTHNEKEMKEVPKSMFEVNRNKIQTTVCRRCNENFGANCKSCPKCSSQLEWVCNQCGSMRSYSNLSVHNCNKILKRNYLKERFRTQKKLVKKTLEKELKTQKSLENVKIENLINKD